MKRLTALAACLVVLVLALGCANDRAALYVSVDAYSTALETLTAARQAELIDDEEAAQIDEWRVLARDALDDWRAALAGDPHAPPAASAAEAFARAMRELTDAVDRLTASEPEEAPDGAP